MLALVHDLNGRALPPRPVVERPFRPTSLLVTAAAVGGVRIGEALDDVIADAGRPTELDEATMSWDELRADYDGAAIFYGADRTVTTVDVLFSTGIRTPFGDRAGTPKELVREHYPHAVPLNSSCTVYKENLVVAAARAGYVLDFTFIRGRLEGVLLESSPRLTKLCRMMRDGLPVPNPTAPGYG